MKRIPVLLGMDDLEVSNVPLEVQPKDIRAKHCKTAKELDLFLFSSNYQTYLGGHEDLLQEVGVQNGMSIEEY